MFKPRQTLLGELVPFEDHIDDDIVLLKADAVLAMFAVDGLCPDTADEIDINNWFQALHNAQLNIHGDDVELISFACRTELGEEFYQSGQHIGYPGELSDAYRENLLKGTMYANPLYLGVQIHPPNVMVRGIAKIFRDPAADTRDLIDERVARLREICNLLQTQLKIYGLRRLGYVERGSPVIYDEIAEAIVFAATGVWRPIGATTGRMGNAMFSEDIHFRGFFRRRHIEFDIPGRPNYAVMFAFREYPRRTWPGMFQSLMTAPYRCTIAQSFRFLSNADADSAVGRKHSKMLIARDKAHSQTEDLATAANQFLNREWVLGDHSLVAMGFADSRPALTAVSHAMWRDIAACGLVATRMSRTLKAAWLSILPGGESWRPRPGYVSSANFTAFAPQYNWPQGEDKGHWDGPPIAILRTLGGTALKYHWHVGDVGNTLVTGATGSGKTTAVGFLIAMTSSRARIIGLDHKRGWQFLVGHLGGDYGILGARKPRLAPLKTLTATPHNIEFLIELSREMIGGAMKEEENRRNALAIETVMSLPPPIRSWREVRAFFDNDPEGAGARLEKWCWPEGELGWVLDAPEQDVKFDRLSVVDTTALLQNPRARGPALAYLFHMIYLRLDGTPTLIPIDEGWRALGDTFFRFKIEEQLRTIRSKNGAVVFITQGPSDITESGIANVLIEQCPTQFHFANPRARAEDYKRIGLTEGQIEAHHGLQSGQGLFVLVQGPKSVVAQLPLDGMDQHLRILSAREEDLTAVDHDNVVEFREAAE